MANLATLIAQKIHEKADNFEPFYIIDIEQVCAKYVHWQSLLPMVKPHYAIKCNPNPTIIHALDVMGAGFDCASADEIDRVMDMGVSAERVIFANPAKFEAHIAHAKLRDVKKMTFDNEDELIKVARIFPEAQLVLRIITDDSQSMCKFSSKFGATMADAKRLLQVAHEHNMQLHGVSFHVGSGATDATAFSKAIADARTIFGWAKDQYGYDMKLVDIGGGFQGVDGVPPTLRDVASHVVPALEAFPAGTQFISEPGRYFSAKSHTMAVRIHSRRVIRDETGRPVKVLYYVNDGVYQSFNCIFFDHQEPKPVIVADPSKPDMVNGEKVLSTIFGPTCDSMDCIVKDFPMPLLECGQWMFFPNMGSYTTAAATRFNGFAGAVTCHYMWGNKLLEGFCDVEEAIKAPGSICEPVLKAAPAVAAPAATPVASC